MLSKWFKGFYQCSWNLAYSETSWWTTNELLIHVEHVLTNHLHKGPLRDGQRNEYVLCTSAVEKRVRKVETTQTSNTRGGDDKGEFCFQMEFLFKKYGKCDRLLKDRRSNEKNKIKNIHKTFILVMTI